MTAYSWADGSWADGCWAEGSWGGDRDDVDPPTDIHESLKASPVIRSLAACDAVSHAIACRGSSHQTASPATHNLAADRVT